MKTAEIYPVVMQQDLNVAASDRTSAAAWCVSSAAELGIHTLHSRNTGKKAT